MVLFACNRSSLLLLACCLTLVSAAPAGAENWPRFRGENGTGTSDLKGLPTNWSPGDYDWTVELPGVGHSSPIIWGDKLFITSAVDEGAVRYLFCLDATTGDQIWSTATGFSRSHKHAKSSWASGTPATDGERVYVAFADKENYTLTAYDFDGNLVWRRNLGNFESQHGHGVSPIVYKDMVILANDQDGSSSVVAFDAKTGQTRWSTLRGIRETAYSTPFILELPGEEPQLICASGATGISSLDPDTGFLNWQTGALPLRTVASPFYGGGLIFASCGAGKTGGVLLIGVDPTNPGSPSDQQFSYKRERRGVPYVPTSFVRDGYLYLLRDDGIATCVDLQSRKDVWTQRLGGDYSSSPICVDGKIYVLSEQGDAVVYAASPEFELLGRVPLGEGSHATPAVANDRLYLRTFSRLMALKAETPSE